MSLAVLSTLLLSPPGSAAQAREAVAFETSVEIVRLSVTVSKGGPHFLTGLGQEDFQIFEDGVRQEITLFSRRSAPLTLILLLDISASMTDRLPQVQEAASRFVRALGPADLVRVAQFKDRVTVLQDFTSDRSGLEAAIRRTDPIGATALHNALYDSIRTLSQRRSSTEIRRQAIVVLSDGDDTASVVSEDQVLDFARRSEVAIYGIGLGPNAQDRSVPTRGLELLGSLSRETGGALLLRRSVEDLEAVYGEIADELGSQYTLGYSSSNTARDGRWRRIGIQVPGRGGLQVRHRLGYYATSRDRRLVAAEPGPPRPEPVAGKTSSRPQPSHEGPLTSREPTGPEPDEWMDVRDGVLELQLALEESEGAAYGVLRVDPGPRRLVWSLAPESEGHSGSLELSFDDVVSVSASKRVGFVLELRGRPEASGTGTMVLLPAPSAAPSA